MQIDRHFYYRRATSTLDEVESDLKDLRAKLESGEELALTDLEGLGSKISKLLISVPVGWE